MYTISAVYKFFAKIVKTRVKTAQFLEILLTSAIIRQFDNTTNDNHHYTSIQFRIFI